MSGPGNRHRPNRLPAKPLEEPMRTGLNSRVEPQSPSSLGPRTSRPDQRCPSSLGRDQPTALPPTDIRAFSRRPQAHPTDDPPGTIARNQYDGPRILIPIIKIGSVEKPLLIDENRTPQVSISLHCRSIGSFLDHERRWRFTEQRLHVRGTQYAGSLDHRRRHAPAADNRLQAPHAAQPAP
jgi:hypothetical protein